METRVAWQGWSPETFSRAARENKPVLLHIGAVWCHWCHVMDKTTYQDDQVVSLVNERFVPVRVDTDRRPDVNRRYNMGGWPTTAFLTPTGRVLTGATYVPPEQMATLCRQVLEFWERNGDRVNVDPFSARTEDRAASDETEDVLNRELLDRLAKAVADAFDAEYGGFGRAPKFPQPAALELALDAYLRSGDDRYRSVLETTLDAMAGGGMYDPVEGGFFRYSTTRDWSVPHFEKMLEDNAKLLDLYLRAAVATGRERYLDTARDVLRFWETVLTNRGTPYLAGSQDADEVYYALPLEGRRRRTAPFVDRTVYTDWNALAARALLRAGRMLARPELTAWGVTLVKTLDRDLRGPDGGMAHFRPWAVGGGAAEGRMDPAAGRFTGEPELPGLLGDQVEMMAALLAVYEETREAWAVDRALELADFLEIRLAAKHGGYFDGPADPSAPGALKLRVKPMEENARAAKVLLELYHLTGQSEFEERARRTLAAQTGGLERYGSHAAVFGLALEQLLEPLLVVVVRPLADGQDGAAGVQALAAAVRAFPLGSLTLAVQDTAGPNEHQPETLYPAGDRPLAYVCAGTTCFSPVDTPEQLSALLRQATRGVKREGV